MLFRRFYDTALAQATYLIGCQATGEAIVIDPTRDLAPLLAAADEEGVRIAHVTETHIHADFVSGARDLARVTGAQLLLSGEGGTEWQYAFADAAGARRLHDGDVIMVGNIRLDVWHVPGHTPEHLLFLVTDLPAASGPMGIVTGDLLFVGDVGRPDLLERAAHHGGTMEPAARDLYRSLARVRALPDHLQVWPGHGAGSACGKALGAVPMSTLGYERQANWGLRVTDVDTFVAAVLEGQPEPPAYFAEMKRLNRDGPPPCDTLPTPPALEAATITTLLAQGTVLIDTRAVSATAQGFIPGALTIPAVRSFSTWVGSLLPIETPVVLLVDPTSADPQALAHDLAMIGFDHVVGWFGLDALTAWTANGHALERRRTLSTGDVAQALAQSAATVVDVRGRSEWNAGHLPGARHIPLGALPSAASQLAEAGPLIAQCQSGTRSAIAVSVLRRAGLTDVAELDGGFFAWRRAGHSVDGVLAGAER